MRATMLGIAAPLLLAGLLPLQPGHTERWGWSGSWIHPIGDPYTMGAAGAVPAFRVMRGVRERARDAAAHQGADLSNGRGGDPVHAAGNGLVVRAAGRGWHRGFGGHVVIAHRLEDGSLVYSVYAHLAAGSVVVREGRFVAAGRRLGRVGMTGRATSPHLHFEIRKAGDPARRWEHAPVVDPLAFVAARLPGCRADSTWARPYLEWAQCAALVAPGDTGAEPLQRAAWWRTLAAAVRLPMDAVPSHPESLRGVLAAADLLPDRPDGDADDVPDWGEMARDLERARRLGLRLPVSPIGAERRRADCRRVLDLAAPGRDLAQLGRTRRPPTRGDALLALADLAGDPPRKKKPAAAPAAPPAAPAAGADSTTARPSG